MSSDDPIFELLSPVTSERQSRDGSDQTLMVLPNTAVPSSTEATASRSKAGPTANPGIYQLTTNVFRESQVDHHSNCAHECLHFLTRLRTSKHLILRPRSLSP